MLVMLCSAVGPAGAQEAPEAVGPVLDVDADPAAQNKPDVAWNPRCGIFLTVYERTRTAVDDNIWGRYVSGTGAVLGPGPFQITTNGLRQLAPAVAYNPTNGTFLVAWHDNRHGNWEIYAQLWNCEKQPASPPVRVTVQAAAETNPDVICGYDMCWVVWEDLRDGQWEVYGQRLTPAGALLGANIRFTNNPAVQQSPAITYNPENNGCALHSFYVVWEDTRNPGQGFDIYGRQLDNIGPCAASLAVYTGQADQRRPDLAYATASDRYQVVWDDARNGATDIFGRRIGPNGGLAGAEFAIAVAPDGQARPAVTYDAGVANRFLTVWQDNRAGNRDIYGQRTSGGGGLFGAPWTVVNTPAHETWPAVAYSTASNRYFVVWVKAGEGVQGRAIW